MFVNKEYLLMYPLVLFFSLWLLKPISIIPFGYIIISLFLLYLFIYLFNYKKSFQIPFMYKKIFNLNFFIFLLVLLVYSMIITIPTGNNSLFIFIKILIMVALPILFILIYFNIYKFDLLKYLKYIFISSLIFHLFFCFILGHYDIHIGKILVNDKSIGYYSSNELSLYMIFTIIIPGWIYFYYRRNKRILFVITVLPLLHLSKSHLVFYVFSLLLAYLFIKKKVIYLILGVGLIYFFSNILYANSDYIKTYFNSNQIKKIILANEILHTNNFDLDEFVKKVGDGTRTQIIKTYSSRLVETRFIGLGDKAKEIVGNGHDYHNMFFFFHIQYGLISVLAFYGMLFYFLYIGIVKFKKLNFIMIFLIFYILFRSMVITIDPYRVIILLLFLIVIEVNLQQRYYLCKK